MSVLIATLMAGTGAGVGVAATLARYAQKNWTRRPQVVSTPAN